MVGSFLPRLSRSSVRNQPFADAVLFGTGYVTSTHLRSSENRCSTSGAVLRSTTTLLTFVRFVSETSGLALNWRAGGIP